MPEDLGSVMGNNFDTSAVPGKKKLRKVQDHWEDEQGNKYADEAGTQPIKDEAAQAAGGAKAQSVMDPFSLEKQTKTAGWAAGDPGQETKQSVMDWQTTPTDQRNKDQQAGGDFQEYMNLTYPNGLSPTDVKALQDRWNSLSDVEKQSWLESARQRKKA